MESIHGVLWLPHIGVHRHRYRQTDHRKKKERKREEGGKEKQSLAWRCLPINTQRLAWASEEQNEPEKRKRTFTLVYVDLVTSRLSNLNPEHPAGHHNLKDD